MGSINPIHQYDLCSGGAGASAFGYVDTEVGAKIAFIKESNYIPQIGAFTMFELPAGS